MNTPITPQFEYSAGALSLDFVNTVWERPGYLSPAPSPPLELLNNVSVLMEWVSGAEIFPQEEIASVRRSFFEDPASGPKLLRELIAFRELYFQAILTIIKGQPLPDEILSRLNAQFRKLPATIVVRDGEAHKVTFDDVDGDPRRIVNTIVSDSQWVLTSEDHSRLRICGASDCGWVFLDRSKGGRRRWCSMSGCGNREKVSKFLERQKAA